MNLKSQSNNFLPLVSIITVSYNSASTIRDTIDSIIKQTYENIEYIIIDGNSKDETISIINSYKSTFLEHGIAFKYVSENDKGIADAWNKGLSMASGSILGILNSDDWYDKNSISSAVKVLDSGKEEISYGICRKVNHEKEIVSEININFNPQRVYLNFGFSHTTCFVTKKVYERIGSFSLDYKIAVDTDFLLKCVKKKIVFKKCNNITYMRLGGISNKYERVALKEYQKALKKNGYNKTLIFFFGVIKKGMLKLKKS
jgi:glycosyltransferase involved in cell wall biosynthesis